MAKRERGPTRTVELTFTLPVEFTVTATNQIHAQFPGQRLRIDAFAKTEAEAWAHLQRRLQEVIKGTRNVL